MPQIDIEIRRELVCNLIVWVRKNERLCSGDSPQMDALRFCEYLLSDSELGFGTSRKVWLVQELRKDPEMWNTYAQFLRNTDGNCIHCNHGGWRHGNDGEPTLPGQLCRGDWVPAGQEAKPCDCPGFEQRPL